MRISSLDEHNRFDVKFAHDTGAREVLILLQVIYGLALFLVQEVWLLHEATSAIMAFAA